MQDFDAVKDQVRINHFIFFVGKEERKMHRLKLYSAESGQFKGPYPAILYEAPAV